MVNRRHWRGKRKSDNVWVYGMLNDWIYDRKGNRIVVISLKTNDGHNLAKKTNRLTLQGAWVVDPETVGEIVQVRDINDNIMYEGDIVENKTTYDFALGVVQWHNEQLCFGIRWSEKRFEPFSEFSATEKWVIVGNIYDNPDLLKPNPPKKETKKDEENQGTPPPAYLVVWENGLCERTTELLETRSETTARIKHLLGCGCNVTTVNKF